MAAALIQLLAQELSYAAGEAIETKNTEIDNPHFLTQKVLGSNILKNQICSNFFFLSFIFLGLHMEV